MEAANNERIETVSVSHLPANSTISSHQLCLFVLYIFVNFRIIQRNIVNVWNFSNNCMENEIAKGEDVQLGGVAGVSNSTLRRHVVKIAWGGR